MGLFLSLTSVIGKGQEEVVASLASYAREAGGGLELQRLSVDDDHCCVVAEANDNATVFNPYEYLEWDKSSAFISKELRAPVFAFHIHDGDLWMYEFFVNGEKMDQFNPIPDYWEEGLSSDEINSWKGNAATIARYSGRIAEADIANYLMRWDIQSNGSEKAYPEDLYGQEDWQLLDFMKKLQLPYPLDEQGNPIGQTYKLWTDDLPLRRDNDRTEVEMLTTETTFKTKRSWWKLW